MDITAEMRKRITELEKNLSLRQIAIQSGINYITLRKVKNGETKNVSSGVAVRFESFYDSFKPAEVKAKAKPGPKPKVAAAPVAAPAKKKMGRPKKVVAAPAAAPVKKKPGPKPKVAADSAAAPVAAPAKKKMGRPKKVVAAEAPALVAAPTKKKMGRPKKAAKPGPKPGRKPGPKPGRKPGPKPAVKTAPAVYPTNFSTPMLGDALLREIEIAEARIEYLKSLQMVEEEFLKAIGKK